MDPIGNRRILPSPLSDASNSTAALDAAATATSFNTSSVAVTALVLVSALFFIGFFAVYARRFFSGRSNSSYNYDYNFNYDDVFIRRPRSSTMRSSSQQRSHRLLHSSASGARGLDAAAICSLPVITYTKEGNCTQQQQQWCVVCLSEFQENEKVKMIPGCGHVFHPPCIDAWLSSRGSCPLCRCSEMMTKQDSTITQSQHCMQVRIVREEDNETDVDTGSSRDDGGGGESKVSVPVRLVRSSSWSRDSSGSTIENNRGVMLLRRTSSLRESERKYVFSIRSATSSHTYMHV